MGYRTIDVREIENRTMQVVREVRELGTEYIVSVDGKPVAVLRPFTDDDALRHEREGMVQDIAELQALSRLVSESWTSPMSALEALDEVRDDGWR